MNSDVLFSLHFLLMRLFSTNEAKILDRLANLKDLSGPQKPSVLGAERVHALPPSSLRRLNLHICASLLQEEARSGERLAGVTSYMCI